MKLITYIGPGGGRSFTTADGFTVDLGFVRGEPTEVSDANAAHLLTGPHAAEFIEGEPAEEIPPPDSPVAVGAMTDDTGDVPGDDDSGSADSAGSPNDDKEA